MANEVRLIDENVLYGMLEWDNDIERYTLRGLEFGDEIPTIDPETLHPKGRWKGEGFGDYSCSLCTEVVSGNKYNYCPNCGAKMED